MTPDPPPEFLSSAVERRIYLKVQARLVLRGEWLNIYRSTLAALASTAVSYLDERASIRGVDPANVPQGVKEEVEVTHRLARVMMAEFFLIPHERIPLAPLDENGDDLEIIELAR
jgi:hypothetical protein